MCDDFWTVYYILQKVQTEYGASDDDKEDEEPDGSTASPGSGMSENPSNGGWLGGCIIGFIATIAGRTRWFCPWVIIICIWSMRS
jgi:hypothetical protein